MATSLLALIDDIASILDDVTLLTKVAAKKTTGVLGDDLALNAQQVSGVRAERELPVVWAVCKGSFRNKLILVPAALAISAVAPWAVTPLLMVGGAYLCFEGFEKLAHPFMHSADAVAAEHSARTAAVANPDVDLVALEKAKIQGAVRTDFILSAEIVTISLGTVQGSGFSTQLTVLATIAVLMTVGVYGIVAGIVKLDDGGLYLTQQKSAWQQSLGRGILVFAPWMMKTLSVVGTAAMFLVGGGILTHGWPALHHALEAITTWTATLPSVGGLVQTVMPTLLNAVAGVVAGAVVLAGVLLVQRLRGPVKSQ